MGTRYSFLHSEVLEKTGYGVSWLSRKRADLLFPLLDRDFIWMGHNDRPYLIGRDAFLAAFHLQPPLPSISLSEEEYHILTHKYSLWVVYGCHTETFHQADGSSLIRRVRNTYVWMQLRGELSLLHIHSSFPDIEDISPLNPFFDGKTRLLSVRTFRVEARLPMIFPESSCAVQRGPATFSPPARSSSSARRAPSRRFIRSRAIIRFETPSLPWKKIWPASGGFTEAGWSTAPGSVRSAAIGPFCGIRKKSPSVKTGTFPSEAIWRRFPAAIPP